MARPSGGDSDDPADEWRGRTNLDDTNVDLEPSDLLELDADSATPPRGLETLPGYDLGVRAGRIAFLDELGDFVEQIDRRGAARVLHAVRDQCIEDGATRAVADAIVAALAKRAGVRLG